MNPNYVFSKEKHIKILEGLLKLPENKECADCKSKAPRWASTNLGIFICLHCSGIHRSLGVHISKVRSTTLDSWLPEQVAFMQSMGNKKSNAHWEAELPLHYDRGRIENFIRAKYVEKRWILRDRGIMSESLSTSRHDLSSNRPSKRFGRIAEWTNNQHLLCKDRSDSSRYENEPQRQEKNSQPSIDHSASTLKSVNGQPSKELAHVVPRAASTNANGSLQNSEKQVLRFRSSSVRSIAAVPFPKVDYATELFRTRTNDSTNPSDLSGWVQFDSEQESSIEGAKIVPKLTVEEAELHEGKLTTKSSTRKIHPGPERDNVQTAMVPFTTVQFDKNQKHVKNNSQSLSKTPEDVSMSSIHHQRLAMLAQDASFTDASKYPGNVHRQGINNLHRELNVNGGTVQHTTKTQLPLQNFQPAKLAVNSVPDSTSSLYRPGISFKSKSITQARGHPLPVSGYDYDFSFLTQGMFKKR